MEFKTYLDCLKNILHNDKKPSSFNRSRLDKQTRLLKWRIERRLGGYDDRIKRNRHCTIKRNNSIEGGLCCYANNIFQNLSLSCYTFFFEFVPVIKFAFLSSIYVSNTSIPVFFAFCLSSVLAWRFNKHIPVRVHATHECKRWSTNHHPRKIQLKLGSYLYKKKSSKVKTTQKSIKEIGLSARTSSRLGSDKRFEIQGGYTNKKQQIGSGQTWIRWKEDQSPA